MLQIASSSFSTYSSSTSDVQKMRSAEPERNPTWSDSGASSPSGASPLDSCEVLLDQLERISSPLIDLFDALDSAATVVTRSRTLDSSENDDDRDAFDDSIGSAPIGNVSVESEHALRSVSSSTADLSSCDRCKRLKTEVRSLSLL